MDTEAKEMMKKAMTSKEEINHTDPYYKSIDEYIYGLLLLITAGEANNIIQAHPDKGTVGWQKLHERWWKKTEMGVTLIAEQIRNIGRSKKMEEVFGKI
eukprot:12266003-Karenia_brevis.AAC.1